MGRAGEVEVASSGTTIAAQHVPIQFLLTLIKSRVSLCLALVAPTTRVLLPSTSLVCTRLKFLALDANNTYQ